MQSLRRISRWLGILLLSVALWSLTSSALYAQPPAAAKAPEKGWTLPYMVVVLGCGLGLIIVCRPANRTTELPFVHDAD